MIWAFVLLCGSILFFSFIYASMNRDCFAEFIPREFEGLAMT